MQNTLQAITSGVVSTSLMTLSFYGLRQAFEPHSDNPLPPRQVTTGILNKTGLAPLLSESQTDLLTFFAHYGFGLSQALLFDRLTRQHIKPSLLEGTSYGLSLWMVAYCAVLPSLGVMPPESQKHRGRIANNALSHVVWGITTAFTLQLIRSKFRFQMRGELR